MIEDKLEQSTHRRGFLGILASGAAALGLTALTSPLTLNAQQQKGEQKGAGKSVQNAMPKVEADVWFDKVKGRHRVVYDSTRTNEIMQFAWPAVFLMTNAATGTPATDCGVVVVMRHEGIPFAFKDAMWQKYNFGDVFKAHDLGP